MADDKKPVDREWLAGMIAAFLSGARGVAQLKPWPEVAGRLVAWLDDRKLLIEPAERDKYMVAFGEVTEQLSEYTKAAKKAWKAENNLRSDFGELAKDLRKAADKLRDAPVPYLLIANELNAWASTAEVAANADIYEALTNETDSGDFGPVPRPEGPAAKPRVFFVWGCPVHLHSHGPVSGWVGDTAFCPVPGCSHNSEEST